MSDLSVTSSVPSEDLTLYSRNMYGVPFAKNLKHRMRDFVAGLGKSGDGAEAPDVVAVQEAFLKYSRKTLAQSLEHPYFSMPKARGGRVLTSGLATLSQHPIVFSASFPFKDSAFTDRFALKSVLYTIIRHPVYGLLRVLNTHTQAAYKFPLQFDTQRSAQFETLREIADGTSPALQKQLEALPETLRAELSKDLPTFIMGDLNVEENDGNYAKLIDLDGFQDIARELFPGQRIISRDPSNPYVPDDEKPQRLDYILFRKGKNWEWDKEASAARVVDDSDSTNGEPAHCDLKTLSDHNGLFVKIRLKPISAQPK